MSDGTREQLFLVSLWVDGVDCGVWDKYDGGTKQISTTKYRSGGEIEEEDLGGSVAYTDITLTRNYRLARDATVLPYLLGKCGTGGQCEIHKQPLDQAYTAYGSPIVAKGPLNGVDDPKVDSNGTNAGVVVLTIGCNSLIAPQ